MRLGRVTGTVTATIKHDQLTSLKLLLVDLVDGAGQVIETAHVAPDTCGAGIGDTVLIASGSAARMVLSLSSAPVDLAVIAVVDRVAV